ncbi:hypothetical protein GSI_08247 [Ganoderma sinense ZZ0214-1]|uniref:Chromo domain-containing protein n=1 Tax=Ganoderma sinense ZZ0214-1 TaxID=1077348 RepID=A0A2G8S752_9APHY|nr:hypothetical protein GSI_08247 [Ganoderma sinense ZZ0214-1]
MAKKKQPVIVEDDSDDEDTQFVVEVVKAAKVEDGEWKYLVKWANYSSSEDTWEPDENLEKCNRLLTDFWRDVGVDDDDYFEGEVVHARPSWIKKEKKMFAKLNNKKVEESSEDDSDDEPMPSLPPDKKKGKGKVAAPSINKNPKGKAVAKKPTTPKKRVKTTKVKHERLSVSIGSFTAGSLQIELYLQDDSDNVPLSSVRSKGKKRAKALVASSDDDEADKDAKPLSKAKKATIVIPPMGSAKRKPLDPDHSDSAGSLFSEKSVSSPEVALKSLPTPAAPATIPMKRPSIDVSTQRTAKRQIVEMPMQITGTAGNATKARLAQRIPQPPPTAGPSAPQKLDLSKMSFRKNSAATAGPSPAQSPVISSPVVPPLPRRSTSASDGQSPAPGGRRTPTFESHAPAGMVPAEPRRPALPLPRRTLSGLAQPLAVMAAKDPMAEADRFLTDIMPAAMASPMQEDALEMPPPPVPVRATQAKPLLPRIQKKWKWTGDLFIDVSRDRAERLCEIMLSEPTEPLPGGLRFNICLTGENIRLSAFHNLSFLHLFLLASARAQQFAKLTPAGDKDADAIKQLGAFMKSRSFFSFAHLYLDDSSVGLLLVFPAGHEISEKLLKVPPTLPSETPLQVALVPWELTTKEFRAVTWKSRSPTLERTLDPAFAASLEAAGRKVTTQRRFYQALHILGFPKSLYEFLFETQSPRPYCIWNEPAETTSTGAVGYETSLLKEILGACSLARDMGHKADVRIVFVHVGALETLHVLPALAMRRMKQSELRFMTYGTHPSVPRERWGIREIYVLGQYKLSGNATCGIVTFTPSAIIEGHWKAFRCIKEIAEHPIWDCYILPSVVAMIAKLTCQGQHPLRVYDEGNFVYEDLLKAIEQGTIALLHAPPVVRDPAPEGDASLLWTRWMLCLPSMNARQILEECLRIAAEQFANTSAADLPMAIEKEIARDMLRMQMQPVIMDKYRRFVVVKGKGQTQTNFREDKGGIEVTTISELDFKDDFSAASTDTASRK